MERQPAWIRSNKILQQERIHLGVISSELGKTMAEAVLGSLWYGAVVLSFGRDWLISSCSAPVNAHLLWMECHSDLKTHKCPAHTLIIVYSAEKRTRIIWSTSNQDNVSMEYNLSVISLGRDCTAQKLAEVGERTWTTLTHNSHNKAGSVPKKTSKRMQWWIKITGNIKWIIILFSILLSMLYLSITMVLSKHCAKCFHALHQLVYTFINISKEGYNKFGAQRT